MAVEATFFPRSPRVASHLVPLLTFTFAAWATLANAARFKAGAPSAEQASSAWSAVDGVRSALRSTAGPVARLRAAISPAPFLRRSS